LDITAEKGTKASSWLTVQDDPSGTFKLLVHVINGAGEGPVLAVTGGMYGTQYGGIDAIIQTANEIDPNKLNGTLILVPVLNVPAFQKGVDRSPIDGLGLNSVFPGDPDGTISRRIAHAVFNEIIKKVQYHLDIRGGDLHEGEMDFASCGAIEDKEWDDKNVALLKILGLPYYLIGPYGEGTLTYQANKAGIYSIVLMGYKGFGTYDDEDIQKCKRGIHNLLKHLNMLEGEPEVAPKITEITQEYTFVLHAKVGGLLYMDVEYQDYVKKGQKLGEIRNLKGEVVQEFTTPVDGYIHATWPKHIKQPGEIILNIRSPV
jgi:predicted deacylase